MLLAMFLYTSTDLGFLLLYPGLSPMPDTRKSINVTQNINNSKLRYSSGQVKRAQ
jgi:hypothetical protein